MSHYGENDVSPARPRLSSFGNPRPRAIVPETFAASHSHLDRSSQSPQSLPFTSPLATSIEQRTIVQGTGQSSNPTLDVSIHAILSNATSSSPQITSCEQCEIFGKDINYCNVCKSLFCDECWLQQFVHKKEKLGPGSIPHEKTKPKVAEKVRNALTPLVDDRVLAQICRDDELTSWFGIERASDSGPPIFQDYGRFSDLMSSTDPIKRVHGNSIRLAGSQRGRDTRTPSLVSFVGQTGAGKSTLIRLLIDLASDDTTPLNVPQETIPFPTPVIGATGGHLPTSEDVHLYLDPRTAYSMSPVLFADCEGLEGGEREPTGAKMKKRRKHEEGRSGGVIKAISEHEIAWANSPRTRAREYAVTNLYPRLLFSFSDVIIFVLKNPRVVEHVFEKLIEWAAAAIETSSNQPVLPHAIIILNASENGIDPALWNVNINTSIILDDLADTVNRNEIFSRYALFWRSRGKTIDTLEQLIASYYSSVQILRVPADGRPKLMQEQVGKLYRGLITASVAARGNKANLRMLLDVDGLQSYLSYAFSHFSRTLELPFDFVQASFVNSPIPANFGGNILKLAINIMDVWQRKTTIKTIFEAISYMVASCIMFESVRNNIPGNVEQIFPKCLEHIDAALENFCDQHWPCEFVIEGMPAQCVNVRNGHGSKGHQLKNGKVFAIGDYVSQTSFAEYGPNFRDNVYRHLEGLLEDLRRRLKMSALLRAPVAVAGDSLSAADEEGRNIHRDSLHSFYNDIADGGSVSISEKFNSHTACFSCLLEPPEHTLPCGHVLCTPCIKIFGHSRDPNEIEMRECPIEEKTLEDGWSWKLYMKPKSAGVRILILDGGGMRGIVELETIRAIEDAIGVHLPIQCFFDLIVGTSTGGLIALGLGSMNWSVEQCIDKFQSMCRTAFTRRMGGSIPGVRLLVDNYNHSKYETKPLEMTLQAAFTENEYLFGGPKRNTTSRIKVAVTATSLTGRTAIVLGNYNRHCVEKLDYEFQRSERKDSEMKVWEAARATSAAPRFFKAFYHQATQKTLVDGAIWHNNPIRIAEQERKLIWPELREEQYPDIILSLGTASSPRLRGAELHRVPVQRGIVSHVSDLINLLKNHMATSIECERIWKSYLDQVPKSVKSARFVRINPELAEDVPNLDDVDKMVPLQETVEEWLSNQTQVKNVAVQLITTCFYFELLGSVINGKDGYIAEGRICCRFAQASEEIRELGKFLWRRGEQAKFVIKEQNTVQKNAQYVPLPADTVKRMISDRIFMMPLVSITISEKLGVTEISLHTNADNIYLISGFPRSIFNDEVNSLSYRRSVSSNPNRWAGASPRRKKVAQAWKPPAKDTGIGLAVSATVYAIPMQSQRHLPIRVSKGKERQQHHVGDVKPLVHKTSQYLRLAFRALARPVRSRSPPSYEEWLATLKPGSSATLEDYYAHQDKDKSNLRRLDKLDQSRTPSSIAATVGDDDDYQVDAGESQVYHSWLNGLQIPAPS